MMSLLCNIKGKKLTSENITVGMRNWPKQFGEERRGFESDDVYWMGSHRHRVGHQ
jgi:hypothetical protein